MKQHGNQWFPLVSSISSTLQKYYFIMKRKREYKEDSDEKMIRSIKIY